MPERNASSIRAVRLVCALTTDSTDAPRASRGPAEHTRRARHASRGPANPLLRVRAAPCIRPRRRKPGHTFRRPCLDHTARCDCSCRSNAASISGVRQRRPRNGCSGKVRHRKRHVERTARIHIAPDRMHVGNTFDTPARAPFRLGQIATSKSMSRSRIGKNGIFRSATTPTASFRSHVSGIVHSPLAGN